MKKIFLGIIKQMPVTTRLLVTYIVRLNKEINPSAPLSADAKVFLATSAVSFIRYIVRYIVTMTVHARSNTVSCRDVINAIRLALTGELARHAVFEMTKAVTRYESAGTSKKSRAEKAGLIIPPARVEKILREEAIGYKNDLRFRDQVGVCVAALVEYLLAEIVEISSSVARGQESEKITRDHVMTAIRSDAELNKTFFCTFDEIPTEFA